jgi:hypothetical protein
MTAGQSGVAKEYARFLGLAVAVAAVVALVGYQPALRTGGPIAVPALLAGCGIAVIASALGGVPIALSGSDPTRRPQAVLLSLVLRFTAVLALGLAAVASGRFASRQLVVWTAVGYVAQLVVDSRYAMQPTPARRVGPGGGLLVDENEDGDSRRR